MTLTIINWVLGILFISLCGIVAIIIVECFFPNTSAEELHKQAVFEAALVAGAEANKEYWRENLSKLKIYFGNLLTNKAKAVYSWL